jgi:hypothetical protein
VAEIAIWQMGRQVCSTWAARTHIAEDQAERVQRRGGLWQLMYGQRAAVSASSPCSPCSHASRAASLAYPGASHGCGERSRKPLQLKDHRPRVLLVDQFDAAARPASAPFSWTSAVASRLRGISEGSRKLHVWGLARQPPNRRPCAGNRNAAERPAHQHIILSSLLIYRARC